MKLHAIEFENFMLFKKVKKVFSDKEIIGIMAEYVSDPKRSNKGGKTTLIEGILYNLFGDSRAEREVELIHRGAEKMMTKTIWIDGGKKVTIKRGRDIKNNGLLEISGIEKVKEAQEEINKLVGYDKEEFLLTNFFKQMDINQFMDMAPAKKKSHLMKWLKNTHWTILERSVLDDLNEKKKEVDRLQSRIDTLKEELVDDEAVTEEIVLSKRKMSALQGQKTAVEKHIQKLASRKDAQKQFRKRLHDITNRMEEIQNEIEDQDITKDTLQELKDEITQTKKELKGLGNVPIDKRDKLSNQRATAKAKLDRLEEQLERADEMTGTCPILGEACDRIKPDCSSLKQWRADHKKTKVKVRELTGTLQDVMKAQRLQNDLQEAENSLSQAKASHAAVKPLKDEYSRLKTERKQVEGKLTKTASDKLTGLQEELDELNRKISARTQSIGKLRGQLSHNVETQKKIDQTKDILSGLKGEIADLNYVAFMFGKNGIPSQEIENAFDDIEDEANFVLERLGTPLQLEFSPTRELSSWEDTCVQCGWKYPKGTRKKVCEECGAEREKKRKDELQLRVLENGVDEGFHMESGGGKALVSIAVRIALTRLKQRQSHSRFNVLFLDEPDSAFDPVNKKAFTNLITKTLVRDFGFEQVFWISHDKQIQESVPNVLKIKRYETYSKAVWA